MSKLFLDDAELDELTGIARGATKNGVKKTKFQLQAAFLRSSGIAFIPNARSKPIVLRSRRAASGRGSETKLATKRSEGVKWHVSRPKI
jgi:hypothetical protein